jgi:MMPL family
MVQRSGVPVPIREGARHAPSPGRGYTPPRELAEAPLRLRPHEEAPQLLRRHRRGPRATERVEDERAFPRGGQQRPPREPQGLLDLSNLLDFTPLGFVDATLPSLMFCIVFGVSIDYEVFLLSRIREAYENGDANATSVAKGLVSTAGIITAAAAIIIVVTGAFAFNSVVITKAVGLGLAVAVFVDATIIRVLLVPATMRVLGDRNWWPGGRKGTFGNKAQRSTRTRRSGP